jgi:hypothetical protein
MRDVVSPSVLARDSESNAAFFMYMQTVGVLHCRPGLMRLRKPDHQFFGSVEELLKNQEVGESVQMAGLRKGHLAHAGGRGLSLGSAKDAFGVCQSSARTAMSAVAALDSATESFDIHSKNKATSLCPFLSRGSRAFAENDNLIEPAVNCVG